VEVTPQLPKVMTSLLRDLLRDLGVFGEITKTVLIEVPVNIVYEVIKGVTLSDWIDKYCNDLTEGLILVTRLAKDIPNSELIFTGHEWGTKVAEVKYVFRPIGNFTEVTISIKYWFAPAANARTKMLNIIHSLLMLEKGYKAGLNVKNSCMKSDNT